MQEFDVAIVGGGLIGAAFARAVCHLGISVCIIEKNNPSALYQSHLDNRGLALAYSTKHALETINCWDALKQSVFAIQDVHVSQQGTFGVTKLTATDCGVEALGYVVSAGMLGQVLVQNLADVPNLLQFNEDAVVSASLQDYYWELQLERHQLRAKIVVAADGTNSIMRKILNIGVATKDFAQSAIVTNLSVDKKESFTAFERFTDKGVLALLPFGTNRMKCVWTVDNSKMPGMLACTDTEFIELVQSAIGYRAGRFTAVDTRKIFPITAAYIDKCYMQGVFFIGNAANTLHPVAAQGFNLGMRDVMCLANILSGTRKINDCDMIGQKYINRRLQDQQAAAHFSNNLVEFFANDTLVLRHIRSVGLFLTELVPGFRARIARKGLGIWM